MDPQFSNPTKRLILPVDAHVETLHGDEIIEGFFMVWEFMGIGIGVGFFEEDISEWTRK